MFSLWALKITRKNVSKLLKYNTYILYRKHWLKNG